MLTLEGYRVILAKDGLEALKIYKHLGKKVRLVILDFFLPIMDGDAVFDELRALNPEIDIVLSSGFAEQSKLTRCLPRGCVDSSPSPTPAKNYSTKCELPWTQTGIWCASCAASPPGKSSNLSLAGNASSLALI